MRHATMSAESSASPPMDQETLQGYRALYDLCEQEFRHGRAFVSDSGVVRSAFAFCASRVPPFVEYITEMICPHRGGSPEFVTHVLSSLREVAGKRRRTMVNEEDPATGWRMPGVAWCGFWMFARADRLGLLDPLVSQAMRVLLQAMDPRGVSTDRAKAVLHLLITADSFDELGAECVLLHGWFAGMKVVAPSRRLWDIQVPGHIDQALRIQPWRAARAQSNATPTVSRIPSGFTGVNSRETRSARLEHARIRRLMFLRRLGLATQAVPNVVAPEVSVDSACECDASHNAESDSE